MSVGRYPNVVSFYNIMKRLLLSILLGFSAIITFAQTYKYRATELSLKTYEYGRWSKWSDWEDVNILVVINTDKDVINIYSKTTQEYDIVEYLGEEKDGDGGSQVKFLCVNADGSRCHVRIRQQSNGQRQIYVDFSDIMFVYNIENR